MSKDKTYKLEGKEYTYKELKKLSKEVNIKSNQSGDDLIEALKSYGDNKESNKDKSKDKKKGSGKGSIFYHLKSRCYVGEDEIWDTGVYKVSEPIERLDNAEDAYAVKYENKIETPDLYEIAKRYRVNVKDSKGKARNDSDILAEIVKEK